MKIDLNKIRRAYIIGIKGSGVIALVEILCSRGIEIIGSDTAEKFFTDEILKRLNISYFEKFDPQNVPADADIIIYSTAYNEKNNVEFKAAQEKNLPMVSYPEILAGLFNAKYGIAVCGTHGKTTTSAWLANTLKEIGADPVAVVGSKVKNWNGNALVGSGEYFVAETDEYQGKLKLYDPKAVILTSCDFDHPDFFENFEAYKDTFRAYVEKIPRSGFLVVWGDSVDTLEIAQRAQCRYFTYGFNEENDFRVTNYENNTNYENTKDENLNTKYKLQSFELIYGKKSLGKFDINLPGKHNVLNATAVIAACQALHQDMEKVREVLGHFRGTARRFEYIGQRNGAILIDDYGHHPEEIKATLKTAREQYGLKTIWAIFHPHTFTRTKALLQEFAQSFDDADKVIVLDIYGSAREAQGGVHSEDLVKLINTYNRGRAEYIATIDETVKFLKKQIGADDVIITLGAGNVWEVAEKLREKK